MPVDPGTTFPIFQGMLASNGILGSGSTQLANGLANGLFQYVSTGITVSSIDVGTLGVGTGVCAGVILPPTTLLGALIPLMIGHSISGPMSAPLANAISMGVSVSLASATVQTVNPSVGVGTGKLQLLPLSTGGAVFSAAFEQAGLVGAMSPALGNAVGMAMDSVIALALGVVVISGPPSLLPGSGVGSGKIT